MCQLVDNSVRTQFVILQVCNRLLHVMHLHGYDSFHPIYRSVTALLELLQTFCAWIGTFYNQNFTYVLFKFNNELFFINYFYV